jgi:hypothetical protein
MTDHAYCVARHTTIVKINRKSKRFLSTLVCQFCHKAFTTGQANHAPSLSSTSPQRRLPDRPQPVVGNVGEALTHFWTIPFLAFLPRGVKRYFPV